MIYGYVRVRKEAENRELAEQRQAELLQRDGAEKIIVETDGSQLPELLLQLESGDSVHVITMDRLTRSTGRMLDLLDIFRRKNVTLYAEGQKVNFNFLQLVLGPK